MSMCLKISVSRKNSKLMPTARGVPLAVTHPSTNHSQRWLTALIKRESVFTRWYGRWQQWNIYSLKYVLYLIMQHITLIIPSIYVTKHTSVILYILIYKDPTFANFLTICCKRYMECNLEKLNHTQAH